MQSIQALWGFAKAYRSSLPPAATRKGSLSLTRIFHTIPTTPQILQNSFAAPQSLIHAHNWRLCWRSLSLAAGHKVSQAWRLQSWNYHCGAGTKTYSVLSSAHIASWLHQKNSLLMQGNCDGNPRGERAERVSLIAQSVHLEGSSFDKSCWEMKARSWWSHLRLNCVFSLKQQQLWSNRNTAGAGKTLIKSGAWLIFPTSLVSVTACCGRSVLIVR